MTDPLEARKNPLVIFDGDCGFCRQWIARWRGDAQGKLDFSPASEVQNRFPEIQDFENAVYLIEQDGTIHRGAGAVVAVLAACGGVGRFLSSVYHGSPRTAALAERAYALIARHRGFSSVVINLIWGGSLQRPSFGVSNAIFLRTLALIFLVSLFSFLIQAPGLVGEGGILPAADLFRAAKSQLGMVAYLQYPSLLWISPSNAMMATLCWVGMAAAVAAFLGILQPVCFFVLWAVSLSLTVGGRDFFGFQWDSLLIETGFIAIFLSPWNVRPNFRPAAPPRLARFLAVALLFRLMFCSGVVKLSSGDPTWLHLDALRYHFFTQPIPTPLAWYANQLPVGLLQGMCGLTLLIELIVPFAFFMPRVPRFAAFLATFGLQFAIALTGNYAFFNLLTAALCLFLVDDRIWLRFLKLPLSSGGSFLPAKILAPVAAAILILSTVPLIASFRIPLDAIRPLVMAYALAAPWRAVNSYGLFAVMTTERHEITIQGSDDGFTWKSYVFHYKPGPLSRRPPWVAPYQPRLDWQMWFAALGSFESTPWIQALFVKLLQGAPDVLQLLETNPFPKAPPRYLRALSDRYFFTSSTERAADGNWWKSQPMGLYATEVSLTRRDE